MSQDEGSPGRTHGGLAGWLARRRKEIKLERCGSGVNYGLLALLEESVNGGDVLKQGKA